MARIRTIKPDFFTSLTIADLPVPDRLTFVGLWTHVDDYGKAVDDARLVKAAVWPLDDSMPSGEVRETLRRLSTAGLICRYEVSGRRFFHVTAWSEHQKVSHPTKSRFPDCPKEAHGQPEPSEQHEHPPVPPPPSPHANPPETFRSPPESFAPEQGTGNRERNREEETSSAPDGADNDQPPTPPRKRVQEHPAARRLCALLAEHVHNITGKQPYPGDPPRTWLDSARLLVETDGLDVEQVEWMIHWVSRHDFWRANILSMPTLRKQHLKLIAQIRNGNGHRQNEHDRARAASLAELLGGDA